MVTSVAPERTQCPAEACKAAASQHHFPPDAQPYKNMNQSKTQKVVLSAPYIRKTQEDMRLALRAFIHDRANEEFTFFVNTQSVDIFAKQNVPRDINYEKLVDGTKTATFQFVVLDRKRKERVTIRIRSQLSHDDDSTFPHSHTYMHVDVGEQWMPIADWLIKRFQRPVNVPFAVVQNWWTTNKTSFPFMKLPKELRYCVYEHVIGLRVYPITELIPDGNGGQRTFVSLQKGPGPDDFHRLRRVCKEIRQESRKICWESPYKHFAELNGFITMDHMEVLSARTGTKMLNRISLGFDNAEYCGILGLLLRPGPFENYDSNPPRCPPLIEHLVDLPALVHLNLDFKVVRPGVGYIDPFTMYMIRNGDFSKATSCQKTFIDWYLTLAFQYLRKVRRITLSGHIKNSTRTKWMAIFENERSGKKKYDMTDEISQIVSTPRDQLPPPCFCVHPCHRWKVHGPHPEGYSFQWRDRFNHED